LGFSNINSNPGWYLTFNKVRITVAPLPVTQTPVFSPAGPIITGSTPVTITSSQGAAIHYTIGGATPTASDTLYTGPVMVSDGTVLKAIAVTTDVSPVASTTYVIVPETNRGQWWVRHHPFQINAIVSRPIAIQQYKDMGFSSYMASEPAYPGNSEFGPVVQAGLGWHWFYSWDKEPSQEQFISMLTYFIHKYPGVLGVNVGDETDPQYFPAVAEKIAQVKQLVPNAVVYHALLGLNAYGNNHALYNAYLDQAIQILKVDVLMYDQYPFNNGSTDAHFYENLAMVRERALAAGIPYWNWMQGFGMTNGYQEPSESELRLQAFMSLAYGYSGLSYWTYASCFSPYTNAILNVTGGVSPIGLSLQGAIDEIKNLGAVTKNLTSTGVFYCPASGYSLPTGTVAWTAQAGYPISNVTVTSGQRGFVLGLFNGDDGKKYFMIVNANHAASTSAAATAGTVTITFGASVDKLELINRQTGEVQEVQLTNHTLSQYSLPGGTGDLFRIISTVVPGDANGDGAVDVGDLGILAANYGGSGKSWAQGDFNGDGSVDVGDLGILAANYGRGASGADFDADYTKVFGATSDFDESTGDDTSSTLCSGLGLSLITGLALMGLMLVKLEE
jgi:hypothetical protein